MFDKTFSVFNGASIKLSDCCFLNFNAAPIALD